MAGMNDGVLSRDEGVRRMCWRRGFHRGGLIECAHDGPFISIGHHRISATCYQVGLEPEHQRPVAYFKFGAVSPAVTTTGLLRSARIGTPFQASPLYRSSQGSLYSSFSSAFPLGPGPSHSAQCWAVDVLSGCPERVVPPNTRSPRSSKIGPFS